MLIIESTNTCTGIFLVEFGAECRPLTKSKIRCFFPILELKFPKNVNKILNFSFAKVRIKMHTIIAC